MGGQDVARSSNLNYPFRLLINFYRLVCLIVERQVEPLDQRRRRTAESPRRLAEIH
jgi:hypothetical protein